MEAPAPVLTQEEARHPLWLKVKKHLEERLAQVRVENDKDHDERKTARIRGRINELKYLAALDKPAPQTVADDFKD